MLHVVAGLVVMTLMGSLGVALLRRWVGGLRSLEYAAFGVPAGVIACSLIMIPLAALFGLSALLVVMVAFISAISAMLLWPRQLTLGDGQRRLHISRLAAQFQPISQFHWSPQLRSRLFPLVVVGTVLIFGTLFWPGVIRYESSGLWTSHVWVWNDWAAHLGDTTSFAYGDNFPPENPRLPGRPFSYHFLAALTSSFLVKLGLDAPAALELHSFFFFSLIVIGVFAFARRITGSANSASLALVLFLLAGSLGWILTVADFDRTQDLGALLRNGLWDFGAQSRMRFDEGDTPYFLLIVAQRGYLYGLPLVLLTLTLLLLGVQSGFSRFYVAAGAVAGLLPLSHLTSLMALALITPFLVLQFPSRKWLLALAMAALIATPQLIFLVGSGGGAASAFRLQIGWIAAPDSWLWFWFKNIGLFAPLLLIGLCDRSLLPRLETRFIWAFMPIFVIANLFVFQPWDADNTKFFLYWALGASIVVAALLAKLWRRHTTVVVRTLVLTASATMVLSGLFVLIYTLQGKAGYTLLSDEEVRLADRVREETPSHSTFLVGLQHNHPIPVLAGRRVVMSYPGWIWAYGIYDPERERAVNDMYLFADNTPELLARYHVDYVAIGPYERSQHKANVEAFRSHFNRILATENYEIFAVGSGKGGQLANR